MNAVLRTVGTTNGADNLRCLTYSGSGYLGAVGQNYTPRDDWPRVELASYTRTVNFDAKSAREEQVRRQGAFPARGGGGMLIQGEVRQINLVSGSHAWALQGANPRRTCTLHRLPERRRHRRPRPRRRS